MSQVALCRRMGWTWTELMNQPQWFIEHLSQLLREESAEEERIANRNKR